MTDKTLSINITGVDLIIDASLDAFVKQNGWTETVTDDAGEEIDNPVTRVAKAEEVLKRFIGDTVKAYQINAASEAAREAAAVQADGALDATTLTVTEA